MLINHKIISSYHDNIVSQSSMTRSSNRFTFQHPSDFGDIFRHMGIYLAGRKEHAILILRLALSAFAVNLTHHSQDNISQYRFSFATKSYVGQDSFHTWQSVPPAFPTFHWPVNSRLNIYQCNQDHSITESKISACSSRSIFVLAVSTQQWMPRISTTLKPSSALLNS